MGFQVGRTAYIAGQEYVEQNVGCYAISFTVGIASCLINEGGILADSLNYVAIQIYQCHSTEALFQCHQWICDQ